MTEVFELGVLFDFLSSLGTWPRSQCFTGDSTIHYIHYERSGLSFLSFNLILYSILSRAFTIFAPLLTGVPGSISLNILSSSRYTIYSFLHDVPKFLPVALRHNPNEGDRKPVLMKSALNFRNSKSI